MKYSPSNRLVRQLFPSVLKSAVQSVHTLIFVPSYFDFVRLQNHLKQLSDLSFAVLSECVSLQSQLTSVLSSAQVLIHSRHFTESAGFFRWDEVRPGDD